MIKCRVETVSNRGCNKKTLSPPPESMPQVLVRMKSHSAFLRPGTLVPKTAWIQVFCVGNNLRFPPNVGS